MYQRIVCFKFKKTASEHAIQAHIKDLAGLKETIPQIVNYKGGLTVATQADGEPEWDSMHYLTFVSIEDIETYYHHPAHQAFIQKHKDIWEDALVCNAAIDR